MALLSTIVFACSSGDDSVFATGAERERVERVDFRSRAAVAAVVAFFEARAADDWEEACARLSNRAKALFVRLASRDQRGGACPELLAAQGASDKAQLLKERRRAESGTLANRGGEHVVTYRGLDGAESLVPVVLESGKWLISPR